MDNRKKRGGNLKIILKSLGLFLIFFGFSITVYVFFPLIYWQLVFAPGFSDQSLITPIPPNELVSKTSLQNLIANATDAINNINYQDAKTWFPGFEFNRNGYAKVKFYTISIPKLKIKNALVSTIDTNLSKHLVNYSGTANPPQKGNAVIFGHSTLPQFYNPLNYKTIFTYLYMLKPGDEIFINYNNHLFKYKVDKIILVDPSDISVLKQNYNNSFLTLVTCAPPGTVWKRLVVRATIENI